MCCLGISGIAATLDEVHIMVFHFLIEDLSGQRLIEQVMEKYIAEMPDYGIEYYIRTYKGLGSLKRGGSVQEIKS